MNLNSPGVLTINTGSSSVKLGLYRVTDNHEPKLLGSSTLPVWSISPETAMQDLLSQHDVRPEDIIAMSHRIVHGGEMLTETVRLDEPLDARLDDLAPLAPLHNPVAFEWLRRCRHLGSPDCIQVLVPDTAFFANLPEVARQYALPATLSASYNLRRYGFHGLAHQAMWLKWQSTSSRPQPSRVISIQLGAGCSIAAVIDGKPLDTSMGFTPLEGLVMATRSGDIDPGLVTWLQRQEKLDSAGMERLLNECSGLYGVSGISGDIDVLLKNGSNNALRAIRLYVYRVRKYIGAYMAVLGGVDGILFGGGVGEHSPTIRADILSNMSWCGIELDLDRNAQLTEGNGWINAVHSNVEVHVVQVDEGALLAKEAIDEWSARVHEAAKI